MKASPKGLRKSRSPALSRVRKKIPPPTKIFEARKKEWRRQVKDVLRKTLKETLARKSF